MLPGGCPAVDGIAVVGAVSGYGDDATLHLPGRAWRLGSVVHVPLGQNVGGDLAGAGVHGNVELAPLSAGTLMVLRVPLALPEQLQASTVEHGVHGPVVPDSPGLPTGKGATTPRELSLIHI